VRSIGGGNGGQRVVRVAAAHRQRWASQRGCRRCRR
jgi:hypothetical protein